MTQGIAEKLSTLHLTPNRQLCAQPTRRPDGRSGLGYVMAPFVGALALAALVLSGKAPESGTASVQVSAASGFAATPAAASVDWSAPQPTTAEDFELEYDVTVDAASDAANEWGQEAVEFNAAVYLAETKLFEDMVIEAELSEELICLALNIYFEARSEPLAGKLAVGHVVMNRVSSRNFPGTICDVVQQGGERIRFRCQFSWWCDGKSDDPRNASAWDESVKLASLVYKGHSSDPTAGALWYHADYVKPKWRKAFQRGPKIGRHIFYTKKPVRKGTQFASNVAQ